MLHPQVFNCGDLSLYYGYYGYYYYYYYYYLLRSTLLPNCLHLSHVFPFGVPFRHTLPIKSHGCFKDALFFCSCTEYVCTYICTDMFPNRLHSVSRRTRPGSEPNNDPSPVSPAPETLIVSAGVLQRGSLVVTLEWGITKEARRRRSSNGDRTLRPFSATIRICSEIFSLI